MGEVLQYLGTKTPKRFIDLDIKLISPIPDTRPITVAQLNETMNLAVPTSAETAAHHEGLKGTC